MNGSDMSISCLQLLQNAMRYMNHAWRRRLPYKVATGGEQGEEIAAQEQPAAAVKKMTQKCWTCRHAAKTFFFELHFRSFYP
jgi:hypothetical protein